MECKKEKNISNCNCSYPCSKKGMCCDCITYHRKNNELPACYFPDSAEKTYNRSIEYYISIIKNK